MNFIKKLLIKDYKSVEKPEVRLRYGITAGIIGMVSNAMLCIAKIIVGLIGNSITIIADAVNNLSDAASSAVTTLGFKMSAKPADSQHPYGHARYEQITGLIIAIAIFAIGVLLGKSSIEKIIANDKPVIVGIYTYIVLIVAIGVKVFQMLIYLSFGKAINSNSLKTTAMDSRNDIISTFAALVATIIINFAGSTKVSIDGIFGLAVSLFIVISSIGLIKDTINPLLGEVPDKEVVAKIKKKLLSYDGVLGLHDLMIHNYGATNSFVLVHIEVDAKDNVLKSHEIIDNIEQDFQKSMNMHLAVHMDPIETDNEEVNRLKAKCVELLSSTNGNCSLHDFRVVIGKEHSNILFDVVIPFTEKTTKEEMENTFSEGFVGEEKKYSFIINVDRNYL